MNAKAGENRTVAATFRILFHFEQKKDCNPKVGLTGRFLCLILNQNREKSAGTLEHWNIGTLSAIMI